jgi:rare lipoprotein A
MILTGLTLIPVKSEALEMDKSNLLEYQFESNTTELQSVDVSFTDLGTMKASWYGPRFHGRLTANGEKYDQMGFTAAHKNLSFGTLLKITNPGNNKSVVVRINDRGPYIPGRQIDLSKKVAIELGTYNKGVVSLKVEKIKINGIENSVVN